MLCACLLLPCVACKHDESGITCIWEEIAPGQTRLVTVTANATRSGLQPSIAAVTTNSLDTEPSNNKAAVEVTVLVSSIACRRTPTGPCRCLLVGAACSTTCHGGPGWCVLVC